MFMLTYWLHRSYKFDRMQSTVTQKTVDLTTRVAKGFAYFLSETKVRSITSAINRGYGDQQLLENRRPEVPAYSQKR